MIRKFFASLIVLIVLLATALLSFAYAMLESYLNPNFYQNESIIEEVYEVGTDIVKYGIEETKEKGGPEAEGLEYVDVDELTEVVRDVLPPEYITDINKEVIEQLQEYPMPDEIVIDLSELKEKLPDAFIEVVTSYVNNIEDCEEGTLAEYTIDETPECIPAEVDRDELIEQLYGINTDELFEEFPADYKIDTTTMTEESKKFIYYVVNENATIKFLILASYIVMLALVGLIIWKPIKAVLWWVGNTLFWGALPLALMNTTINGTIKYSLPMLADQQPEATIDELERVTEMVKIFLSFVTDRIVVHGYVLGVIGLAMIIVSIVLRKSATEEE